MYTVYIRQDFCPWCEKAKKLLTEKNIEFQTFTVNQNITKEALREKMGVDENFRLTVPQIFDTDGNLIGGYTELAKKFDPTY